MSTDRRAVTKNSLNFPKNFCSALDISKRADYTFLNEFLRRQNMKKRLGIVLSSIALMLALVFTLCACSSYGGIKSAFEDAGYEEVEISDTYKKQAQEFFGKDADLDKAEIHILQKKADEDANIVDKFTSAVSVVIIVEFNSDDELVENMEEQLGKENVENAYEELQKLPTVNGNCVLVLCSNSSDAKLFKD